MQIISTGTVIDVSEGVSSIEEQKAAYSFVIDATKLTVREILITKTDLLKKCSGTSEEIGTISRIYDIQSSEAIEAWRKLHDPDLITEALMTWRCDEMHTWQLLASRLVKHPEKAYFLLQNLSGILDRRSNAAKQKENFQKERGIFPTDSEFITMLLESIMIESGYTPPTPNNWPQPSSSSISSIPGEFAL